MWFDALNYQLVGLIEGPGQPAPPASRFNRATASHHLLLSVN